MPLGCIVEDNTNEGFPNMFDSMCELEMEHFFNNCDNVVWGGIKDVARNPYASRSTKAAASEVHIRIVPYMEDNTANTFAPTFDTATTSVLPCTNQDKNVDSGVPNDAANRKVALTMATTNKSVQYSDNNNNITHHCSKHAAKIYPAVSKLMKGPAHKLILVEDIDGRLKMADPIEIAKVNYSDYYNNLNNSYSGKDNSSDNYNNNDNDRNNDKNNNNKNNNSVYNNNNHNDGNNNDNTNSDKNGDRNNNNDNSGCNGDDDKNNGGRNLLCGKNMIKATMTLNAVSLMQKLAHKTPWVEHGEARHLFVSHQTTLYKLRHRSHPFFHRRFVYIKTKTAGPHMHLGDLYYNSDDDKSDNLDQKDIVEKKGGVILNSKRVPMAGSRETDVTEQPVRGNKCPPGVIPNKFDHSVKKKGCRWRLC